MWVVTVINAYSRENNIIMFEFKTEREARETFVKLQNHKIFSEIICCYNPASPLAVNWVLLGLGNLLKKDSEEDQTKWMNKQIW